MLGNAAPRAFDDLLGLGSYVCSESLCRTHLRIRGPKLVSYEGSFKKGLGQWGHSIGLGPRAHMSLGISVPYISPPLIHTWLSGRIKELTEPFGLEVLGQRLVVMASH